MAMLRGLRVAAARVSARSRARKLRILTDWIEPGSSVLLVGASAADGIGTESYIERGLDEHAKVVALTYAPIGMPIYGMPTLRGDARRLPFPDGSFDYVISNAVIEHVGGPAGALAMIRESDRVARIGWAHTTPNRRFPIEVHTGVPVLHWLPEQLRSRAFAAVGRPTFIPDRTFLFTGSSLRRLGGPPIAVHAATGLAPALTLFVASPGFRVKRP